MKQHLKRFWRIYVPLAVIVLLFVAIAVSASDSQPAPKSAAPTPHAASSLKKTLRYTLSDFGIPTEGEPAAFEINNDGQVLVAILDTDEPDETDSVDALLGGGQRWYVWTPNTKNGSAGKLWGLGQIVPDDFSPEFGLETRAHDLNDRGEVVGVSGSGWHYKGWSAAMAFKTHVGKKLDETCLLKPNYGPVPYATNNRGVIVGSLEMASTSHAIKWSSDGQYALLGKLRPSDEQCGATDINDRGAIVGYSDSHAWMLTGMHKKDLGEAAVGAINNCNVVVGSAHGKACIWRGSSRQLLDRRQVPPGFESWASDINDWGEVVGGMTVRPSDEIEDETGLKHNSHAVLWENEVATDLNAVVELPPGWTLENASSVNNRGQILVTGNTYSEEGGWVTRSFLLNPIRRAKHR